MKRRLLFHPEKCLLCGSCVLACQMNSLGARDVRRLPAGIPPKKLTLTFSNGTPWLWHCRQCTNSPCVEACVSGSLRRGPEGGIAMNEEACVGCGSCFLACPFGCPAPDPKHPSRYQRCNLCPESEIPPCAKACPTGALVCQEAATFSRGKMKRFLKNPGGCHGA